MALNRFVSSSILLLLDKLTVAAGNWIYWLFIAKFTFISEVGQATTVYNFVGFITALTQIGLEYPLLKKASVDKSQILWTALTIELAIALLILPLAIYFFTNMDQETLQHFTWIIIGMLISNPVAFVARFVLLGISDAKRVYLIDLIGLGIRFGTSYAFIGNRLDAFELLLSVFLQTAFVAIVSLVVANRAFCANRLVRIGGLKYMKKTVIEGLVNMPSKLSASGSLIVSLCITLLAFFSVPSSEIAAFYIALIVSIVAGSLVSSMAYMLIPASVISKTDLSSASVRMSITLTAPLITLLVTSPKYILSMVGTEYTSAATILLILSAGILPYSIVTNAVSRFNYLSHPKKVLFVGSVQIVVFLIGFILLVPLYGTYGSAFSIFISFICSSIPSMIWLGKGLVRYIATSGLAIIAGWTFGQVVNILYGNIVNEMTTVISSSFVTLITVIALKNTSISEIRHILATLSSVNSNRTGH